MLYNVTAQATGPLGVALVFLPESVDIDNVTVHRVSAMSYSRYVFVS